MLVRKQIKLDLIELKVDAEAGTFEGYASKSGGVDSYGDTIVKGAFASTLRNNGKPKMFFGHDWSSIPIGKYPVAKEDDNGLYVKGEFTPEHSKAQDVRAAMKHGTLDGLSIGGFVSKGDAEDKEDGGQLIHKFTRLVEVSPVVFPADKGARVDLASVKGEDLDEAVADLETIRDFERLLRDAGGFSKRLASELVSRAKVIFDQGEPVSKGANASAQGFLDRLERIRELSA